MTDYVMFLDESGDHNLKAIDENCPLFCLCGCIFEKGYYHEVARPLVDEFKMRFWNSTDVILHSRDIRRHREAFYFLKDGAKRREFYGALNQLIVQLDFSIIAAVILKREHIARYGDRAEHLSYNVPRDKICTSQSQPPRILGYGIKIFPQATFDHYSYIDGGYR